MKRIFYVEDEPFLAKIVKETLEGEGYSVTLIQDGESAIQSFEPSLFDLCVLDVMLPFFSGFEVAKEIRQRSSKIPIIFLTAKDSTEDVVRGFKIGANDYLRKPFSMEELMVRIEHLLSYQSGTINLDSDTYRIGDNYVFSNSRMELLSKDDTKKLSHKEAIILTLLCKNLNQVTSRKDILLEVWGDDSFFNSRNLDVYISRLRAYFKENNNISILTLKGVGYRFIVG